MTMPLIFGRRPSMANIPGVTPYLPAQDQQQEQPRRGFFGRPRGVVRRADGDPGTFLNYALFGQRGVETMRDRRQQDALFPFAQRRVAREERDAEEARAALEQAIGSLDPALQPFARIAPNVFAQRALAQPEAPDWDLDPATGQPYTITPQGQVRYGEGRVNVRPTGSAERAPPAGYRWTPDGNMEAVPGGPADIRAGESAQRNRRFYETAIRNRQNVLESIGNARLLAQRPGTTGVAGQVFGGLGGTDAHNLQSEVDTIIGNIGFEALQEMRQNSQTGGALGQVAVRELELLQTTIANLRISQSREQFLRNLGRVESQYRRTMEAYQGALQELQGGAPQQDAPVNDGSGPPRARRMRWDPQRGLVDAD